MSPAPRSPRLLLLRWYDAHRRDLPWRRTRDPYSIWVSEIMLQQTRVAAVVPYYERFIARFPDVETLARAAEDDVLGLWSGLGYYRRARSLHAAARTVVDRHAGRVPSDPAALRDLPGVGRYTAGAIASQAFDVAEPILDGNVRRVLARLYGVALDSPAAEERLLWRRSADLVSGPRPGDLNQALMELGAVVCLPRAPACDECPLARECVALSEHAVARYPTPRRRPRTESARVLVAWVRRGDAVLLERPAGASPLRGTWDLPALEAPAAGWPAESVRDELARRHDLRVSVGAPVARLSHGILKRRLTLEVLACRLRSGTVADNPALRWMPVGETHETPTSGATLKVIRTVGPGPG